MAYRGDYLGKESGDNFQFRLLNNTMFLVLMGRNQ